MERTRRGVLAGLGMVGLGAAMPQLVRRAGAATTAGCPFRLAVINDEITADFEKACEIAANDFGLHWIELRSMWNKNVTDLSPKEIEDSRKILEKYKLQVTDIASPLFKTDWPGAPRSVNSQRRDVFNAEVDAKKQDLLLEKCISLAKAFNTDRIRCFDYWRLDDQKPFREAINARLRSAAERCAKDGMILLLENEMDCNTGTGEESAATLKAVPNKNFMLNWDPGNAAALMSKPYPDGYKLLPKNRIGHCHCKDVVYHAANAKGQKYDWAPVGGGVVDWVGQLQAFVRDGYHFGLSLETHWRGAAGTPEATPEASTRVSMDGLKKSLVKAGIHC